MIKRPLKLIAAAAFMVALGYGVATNSKISEWSSFVNLSALSSLSAESETGAAGSCTATTKCFNWAGVEVGSVSCSGNRCSRGTSSVTCDGVTTDC